MDKPKDAADTLDGNTHEYINPKRVTDTTALIICVLPMNSVFLCTRRPKIGRQSGEVDSPRLNRGKESPEDVHQKDGSIRLKRSLNEDWRPRIAENDG